MKIETLKNFKKLAAAAVGIACLMAGTAAGQCSTDPWNGTADYSWYIGSEEEATFTIKTPEELAGLAHIVNGTTGIDGRAPHNFLNQRIQLGCDIYLNDVTNSTEDGFWDGDDIEEWVPIGNSEYTPFYGTFSVMVGESVARKIYGLYINKPDESFQGLFGYTSATFSNIELITGKVIGSSWVGALVGNVVTGGITAPVISNVRSDVVVSGVNNVGGLAGTAITVTGGSYSTANVSGTGSNVGGLVGTGNVTVGSYSNGNVDGGSYVGGLTGSGDVQRSFSTGDVIGSGSYVGGLTGNGSVSGTATDSAYHIGIVRGLSIVGGLAGYSTGISFAKHEGTVTATGGGNVGGAGGQVYSSGNVSNVRTLGTVSGTGSNVGGVVGYMSSTGNITAVSHHGIVSGLSTVGGLVGSMSFGIITGSHHTGGNVTGTGTGEGTGIQIGGLIGSKSGGSITGSSHTGGNVSGANYVGGLVGQATSNCVISDSWASGNVSGALRIGGLVGETNGNISASNFNGSVSGTTYVGGLVGSTTGSIISSYSSGNVTGTSYLGGLAGNATLPSSYSTAPTIRNSSSSVSVTGNNAQSINIGGLVGYATMSIINSYSTGDVIGFRSVGGLVGYLSIVGSTVPMIDSCFSHSTVSGVDNIGGLVGQFSGIVKNSFAIGDVVGVEYVETDGTSGNDNIGGLIGLSLSGEILRCYATGDVTGSTSLGGLVGSMAGTTIKQTYAHGNVTAIIISSQPLMSSVGGLVGSITTSGNPSSVEESYSVGTISTADASAVNIGGFIGLVDGEIEVAACYYDEVSSGQASGIGGFSTPAYAVTMVGKTTAEMQTAATFSGVGGWSSWGSLWGIDEGESYPYFKHSASQPIITVQPVGGTIASVGGSYVLSVSARSVDAGELSYMWYKNVRNDESPSNVGGTPVGAGTISADKTTSTFTVTHDAAGVFDYYVVVTNTNEYATVSKTADTTSVAVAVTVGDVSALTHTITFHINGGTGGTMPPPVTGLAHGSTVSAEHIPTNTAGITNGDLHHISGDWAIDPAGTTMFRFGADGTKLMSSLTLYMKWQNLTEGTWTQHPKVTVTYKTGLTLANIPLGAGYSWIDPSIELEADENQSFAAKYVYTASGVVYGKDGMITVDVNLPVNAETPVITTQPVSGTFEEGALCTLRVAAASVSDGGTISYQWYRNTTRSNTGGAPIPGADTTLYAITMEAGTFYYYAVVTNTNEHATGNKAVSTASAAVTLTTGIGAPTDEWDGTADTDWYNDTSMEFTISTAEELAGLRYLVNNGNSFSGKTIKLAANIMLNDITDWENWSSNVSPTRSWTPIGSSTSYPFDGTFDGDGHIVSGVYIYNTSNYYRGLFGVVWSSGIVKNLGVEASYISGVHADGGLVGYLYGGTVISCYSGARIYNNSTGNSFGGLVGYVGSGGTITNSYATGSVYGYQYAGGLVGTLDYGTITNSYSTGSVTGYNEVYGFMGYIYFGTYTSNYYDTQTSGLSIGNGGTGKTTAQMQQQATFSGWDFTDVWEIDEGADYPRLRVFAANAGSGVEATHTITFYLNNGDTEPYAVIENVRYGTRLSASQKPGVPDTITVKEDHHTDSTWCIDAAGVTEFKFGSSGTIVRSDWALYLRWIEKLPGIWAAHDTVRAKHVSGRRFGDVALEPGYAWVKPNDTLKFNDTAYIAVTYTNPNGLYLPAAGTVLVIVITPDEAETPVITRQPVGGSFAEGALCTLSVAATVDDGGTLTYQWYRNTTRSNTGGSPIAGATGASYPLTMANGTFYYYVVVTNTNAYASDITKQIATAVSSAVTLSTGIGAPTDEWDGTEDTDWYNNTDTEFIISTAEELAGFRTLVNSGNTFSGKTIKLAANIMLNDITDWESWSTSVSPARDWTPIGSSSYGFSGTFDGDGHIVSGMYINTSYSSYRGLFGMVNSVGIVKNLGVEASYINGAQFVGGLVGYNYGSVTNCYAAVNVNATSSNSYVGGLVGINISYAEISNSYATGRVNGYYYSGGLVGSNESWATITNSYSTGSVVDNGYSYIGGLLGYYSSGSISYSYYDTETSGWDWSAAGTAKTTAEMQQQATFSNWDFTDVWEINEGLGYPKLQVFAANAGGGVTGSHTVTFYLNNGDTEPYAVIENVTHGTRLSASQKPGVPDTITVKADHHTDSTWCIDPEGITEFKFGSAGTIVRSDWALYLRWIERQPGVWVYHGDVTAKYVPNRLLGDVALKPGYAWVTPEVELVLGDTTSRAATYTDPNGLYLPAEGLIKVFVVPFDEAETPIITKQPVGGTFAAGALCTLSVTATVDDGGTLTYQWYRNLTRSNTGGSPIAGATGASYPLTMANGTFYYYVVVTNTNTHASDTSKRVASAVSSAVTLSTGAAVLTDEWDGAADTDWYNDTSTEFIISTAEEFAGFRVLVNNGNTFSGKTIKLAANIMLNDITGWENWSSSVSPTRSWTPIGSSSYSFNGTFDGDGHVVSGMYINTSSSSYRGLFGLVNSGGIVKNLGVEASYINGSEYVGGLVGYNYGSVTNCYASVNVNATYSYYSYAGGLVGYNIGSSAIITDSYATGTVNGNVYSGGLVGSNESWATITNSYSTGSVVYNGYSNVGGLIGYYSGYTPSSSYWNAETSGQESSYGGTGKTTAQMRQQATFSGWDFVNTWEIDEGSDYPRLRVFAANVGGGVTGSHTITFDLNGGVGTAPAAITAAHGTRISRSQLNPPVNTVTKAGHYTSGAWYIDTLGITEFALSDSAGAVGTIVRSDWTLYLKWQLAHTVTFIDSSSADIVLATALTTGYKGTLDSLPVPERGSGYVLVGWLRANGDTVTASTQFTADDTLYARWELDLTDPNVKFNVSLVGIDTLHGGGAGAYNYNARVVIEVGPAPEGMRFERWEAEGVSLMNPNAGKTTFFMPANDVVITAKFGPIPFPPERIKLTVGPNPVSLSAVGVKFFATGGSFNRATLIVYSASGDVVRRLNFPASSPITAPSVSREIGIWDLKNTKGVNVPAGTYLIRGTVIKPNGSSEAVSLMLGVR